MTPLLDMAEGPAPIISLDEIETIFGVVGKIFSFQEMFYLAVTSRSVVGSIGGRNRVY